VNLRKMPAKKSAKFLILLLTSMLIATVSAEVYRYMYIDGSITVGGARLIWILGTDAPGDASIAGSTLIMDLDVEQGTPLNFTEAAFLKNNSTSAANINITIMTPVSSSDFQRAKMHINENSTASWQYVDTLDLTNGADLYTGSLPAGNYLRITFEVNATISTGTRSFDIQVEY
jgi:hypothetical protein